MNYNPVQSPSVAHGLLDHPLHAKVAAAILALLVALPWLLGAVGEEYFVTFAIRILIFAIAATSLNLILGSGGMVSFGHAAFIGLGAYAVGILMHHGVSSAWIAWPVAVLAGAAVALAVGAVCLRTQGVYFIMITLAFAQMLFFVMVSLKTYGGEDGLPLPARSRLLPGIELANDTSFYYVVLALFALVFAGVPRLLNSDFGHALQAIRENEVRMHALGFAVRRYKLIAFSLSGGLAALAGALTANLTGIVSPSLMHWSQSGTLMVMVILGGVGHLYGGFVGALVYLVLEEVLSGFTMHWALALGAALLVVVLTTPNGLLSLRRGIGK